MKKITILIGCFSLFAMTLLCFAQELKFGGKDTVLIGRLNVLPSVTKSADQQGKAFALQRVMDTLDSQFITSVSATRVFEVVERKRKGDLELERAFAAVAVDPNDQNAAKLGMMAGVKYAFLAQIDGFEDRTANIQSKLVDRSVSQRKIYLSAIVQVIDTTTGKMLPDVPSVQVSKMVAGPDADSDRVFVELAREMAGKLSRKVISLLRPAKVLAVTGNQVLINRGSEAGFQKGSTVNFYAVQEIKDPETGEVFRNEISVGEGKISRVDSKKSFAVITGDNMGIAPGCVAISSPVKDISAGPMKTEPLSEKVENLW